MFLVTQSKGRQQISTGKNVLLLRADRRQFIGKDAVFTCMLEADILGSCLQHLIFKSGSVFADHEYNAGMLYNLPVARWAFLTILLFRLNHIKHRISFFFLTRPWLNVQPRFKYSGFRTTTKALANYCTKKSYIWPESKKKFIRHQRIAIKLDMPQTTDEKWKKKYLLLTERDY